MFVVGGMRAVAGLVVLAWSSQAMCQTIHADEPELFRRGDIDAAILADAINHYVAVGEERAKVELAALAPDVPDPVSKFGELSKADLANRVSYMCLILWPVKPGASRRPPGFGGLPFVDGHFGGSPDWPLFPVIMAGHSYFVLSDGYVLAGLPESPVHYLESCEGSGVFRTQPVTVPTRQQAERDLLELRNSKAWISAWKKQVSGENGDPEPFIWNFLWPQAAHIRQ